MINLITETTNNNSGFYGIYWDGSQLNVSADSSGVFVKDNELVTSDRTLTNFDILKDYYINESTNDITVKISMSVGDSVNFTNINQGDFFVECLRTNLPSYWVKIGYGQSVLINFGADYNFLCNDDYLKVGYRIDAPDKILDYNNNIYMIDMWGILWVAGIYDLYGMLGTANTTCNTFQRVSVSNVSFKSIKGKNRTIYAVDTNDELWSWGSNSNGELGINSAVAAANTPVKVCGNYKIKQYHPWENNILIQEQTTNNWYYFGDGSFLNGIATVSSPTIFSEVTNLQTVSAGYSVLGFVDNSGNLWTSGNSTYGVLGQGASITCNTSITLVNSISNVCKVYFNGMNALAVNTSNTLYGWGRGNAYNIDMDDATTTFWEPVVVNYTTEYNLSICDVFHRSGVTLFRDVNHVIWTWGYKPNGGGTGVIDWTMYPYIYCVRKPYTPVTFQCDDFVFACEYTFSNSSAIITLDEDDFVYSWGYSGTLNDTWGKAVFFNSASINNISPQNIPLNLLTAYIRH